MCGKLFGSRKRGKGLTEERGLPGTPEWAQMAGHHVARYLFAVEFARGRRVLDCGTGFGYGARLLRTCGASTVVAVDLDAATVAQAQAMYGGEGLEFREDSCEEFRAVTGPFDVISSFENIEHLPHPERFLECAGRLLGPDGVLLVSTPDRAVMPPFVEGMPRNIYHVHEWYRDEFAALLASHFDQVEVRVQVEATAVANRMEAVRAMRQGLMWSNPLSVFLWRKFPFARGSRRPWKKLALLAAGGPADYPVVPVEIAGILGAPLAHVAICRKPRAVGAETGAA
jgi:O-antigen biosynthesis protein